MTSHNLPADADAAQPRLVPPAVKPFTIAPDNHSFWESPRVATMPAPPAISRADRAALVAACRPPYRELLRACLDLGARTGRLWAGESTLMARTGLPRATLQRHRAWLVDHAFLEAAGGGYRGRTAGYRLVTPAARPAALEALAAKARAAAGEAAKIEAPPLFDFPALRASVPRQARR